MLTRINEVRMEDKKYKNNRLVRDTMITPLGYQRQMSMKEGHNEIVIG
jgi:hypothetical protein